VRKAYDLAPFSRSGRNRTGLVAKGSRLQVAIAGIAKWYIYEQ